MDNNGDPHGDILTVRLWRSWENGMRYVYLYYDKIVGKFGDVMRNS